MKRKLWTIITTNREEIRVIADNVTAAIRNAHGYGISSAEHVHSVESAGDVIVRREEANG